MFRHRYKDQIGSLRHWDLAHVPSLPAWANEDNQRDDQQDGIKDHAALFKLRMVSREVSLDVSGFFFSREEVWIYFDKPFVAFLQRKPHSQDLGHRTVENTSTVQSEEHYGTMLLWLSKFKHLAIFLHEDRIPDLVNLQTIFQASGRPELESQHVIHTDKKLRFVIHGFTELLYPPKPPMASQGGSGRLPKALCEDQPHSDSKVASVFDQVVQKGKISSCSPKDNLWYKEDSWTDDYVYYSIEWEGQCKLPVEASEDGGESFDVDGRYLNWIKVEK